MTNFERIKSMPVDELAKFLACSIGIPCGICVFDSKGLDCSGQCIDGIRDWLNKETV